MDAEQRMISYLKRIATGPERSRDISREEAHDGMSLILNRQVSDVQAGVFLVALRMKRETDDENKGILDALREETLFAPVPIPELADIADPYDGFKRHIPVSSFLPPLLAACGLPAIVHGCHLVGPKFGVTHQQIFKKAGIPTALTPLEAASRVADPAIGWAYLDQSVFCPPLHQLVELRRLIVKRPSLATLEKMCGPVRAGKNHLMIGYVHPGYETQIPVAARHAGFDSCLTVRGVEGGILCHMNRVTPASLYVGRGEIRSLSLDPSELGLSNPLPRASEIAAENDLHHLSKAAAEIGIAGLTDIASPVRDSLLFSAAALLYGIGRYKSLRDAGEAVYAKLVSGEAKKRFERGKAL